MAASLRQRYFAWLMSHVARRYDAAFGATKAALFAELRGTVVEIGPGTGPNLHLYPEGIRWIGIEPNPGMHRRLTARADELGIPIELRRGFATELELESNSVDAVVSTLVLCSVDDLGATLTEIHRVLRPGGVLIVLEHVAADPGTLLRRIQGGVSGLWQAFNDGCRPDRDTATAIERAGFVDLALERTTGPLPIPIIAPHIVGTAKKPR